MKLEYLKNLENIHTSNKRISKIGVSEIDISLLEEKLNLSFPKAYKEFLFIAGNRDGILGDWNRGFDNLEGIQEEAEESFNNVGLGLRNFFAFAEYGGDQFLFFFLNEGDNPPVYAYDEMKIHKDEYGNPSYYKKTKPSFTDFIEKHIDEQISK